MVQRFTQLLPLPECVSDPINSARKSACCARSRSSKTEVTILLHRPQGESDEARAHRIRRYEDFFNVSGMATPDDLEEFRSCQEGYNGIALESNRYVPRRRPFDRRCRAEPPPTSASSRCSGRKNRRRRPLHRATPLLAARNEKSRGRAKEQKIEPHRTNQPVYSTAKPAILDDKQWEKWLACYHPQASFWMPSWDDNRRLGPDPQREISLIYYPDRQGLEDRVFRIETERSSATIPRPPAPGTTSAMSRFWPKKSAKLTVQFNWLTFSFPLPHHAHLLRLLGIRFGCVGQRAADYAQICGAEKTILHQPTD